MSIKRIIKRVPIYPFKFKNHIIALSDDMVDGIKKCPNSSHLSLDRWERYFK